MATTPLLCAIEYDYFSLLNKYKSINQMKIKEKDGLGELSVGSSRPADGGRSDGIVVKLIQSIDTVTRGPIETGADLTPGGGWRNDKH